MMRVHGEWHLPEWVDPTEHAWQATDHVNRAMSARFGVETTVLRCVRETRDPDSGRLSRVYEMDSHSLPRDMVSGSIWVSGEDLSSREIADPATSSLLRDWFRRDAGEEALRGPPWMRRGWYSEAMEWAAARLRSAGLSVIGRPEQSRADERAFLMKIRTDGGICCFKAVPPVFGHEPALVEWLADRYPQNLPEMVATDPARGWLLHREISAGAQPVNEVREEEEWYRAVRRLGEIQVDCTQETAILGKLGLPHRGLDVLASRIPKLCADTAAAAAGGQALSSANAARFGSLGPTLLALCEELASYEIPDSLEHGDLWATNILSTLSGPVYLDWSHSSLSHPFFSLSQLMVEALGLLPASSRESRRRLRDSYLEPWSLVAPQRRLTRAFEIARVLAPVHFAATIHAELLPDTGYRWEVEQDIPTLMRTALQRLGDDDGPLLERSS